MGQPKSAARHLATLLTQTDYLQVSDGGELLIDGIGARQLVERFGSPLYVLSESTLRQNYRRIRAAFERAWPGPVSVLYAMKANNGLAVRSILSQEGAGGDCFGMAEIQATLRCGADPARVVLNGSNKTAEELAEAGRLGLTVNVDDESEVERLAIVAARLRRPIAVKLRLKVVPDAFRHQGSDYFGVNADLAGYLAAEKWGVVPRTAARIVRRLRSTEGILLSGYHAHVGRVSRAIGPFRQWARALGRTVVQLQRLTGFAPGTIDIGGGWPRERDPESRRLAINTAAIEGYAEAVCAALLGPIRQAGLVTPALWLEPGRYIVGNAELLLATVGTIKRDDRRVWVNVDASTNNLMRIDTSGSRYHSLVATGMHRPYVGRARLVGLTCIDSILGGAFPMPQMSPGEIVAILDAGMYAESASTQFNSLPRPATVLVCDGRAELVKRREAIRDVFALHRVPERLSAPLASGGRRVGRSMRHGVKGS